MWVGIVIGVAGTLVAQCLALVAVIWWSKNTDLDPQDD